MRVPGKVISVNDRFPWNNFGGKPGKFLPKRVNQREARGISESDYLVNTSKKRCRE
jgi:hypothetical protein